MSFQEYIPYISLVVSLVTLVIAQWRISVSNAKELEKRVSVLESKSLTEKERDCLHDIDVKVNLIWGLVERDFPKLLKQEHTPVLDELLDKAKLIGLSNMSKDSLKLLIDELDKELDISQKKEDSGRSMALALYKTVVEYVYHRRGDAVKTC